MLLRRIYFKILSQDYVDSIEGNKGSGKRVTIALFGFGRAGESAFVAILKLLQVWMECSSIVLMTIMSRAI